MPNDHEHDRHFYALVLTATRSEEAARKSLYNRVRARTEAQTEAGG